MQTAAFVPYLLLAVAYNIGAWSDKRWTAALKPLLMPSLMAAYIAFVQAPSPLIVLGLIFGFIGDVALMLPQKRFGTLPFIAGLGAFLLGHVMYIAWLCANTGGWPSPLVPVYGIAAIMAGVMLFRYLKPGLNGMKLPVILYETAILAMSMAAFTFMTARMSWQAVVIWAGSVAFVVSDSVLAEGIFLKARKRSGFIVMTTYTFAQLCIALGAAFAVL